METKSAKSIVAASLSQYDAEMTEQSKVKGCCWMKISTESIAAQELVSVTETK